MRFFLANGGAASAQQSPHHADDLGSEVAQCEADAASAWLEQSFAGVPVVSADKAGRLTVDSPAVVRDSTISSARYGVSIREREAPDDRRIALRNVLISDLVSQQRYGAGIKTHRQSADMQLFLIDVVIKPNWPDWLSYEETNYDGIVLDGAQSIFAQNLSITDWNADSAIDNKAEVSQFVRLSVSGPGHRPLRYWRAGPHYLVHSRIETPAEGTMLWFSDCDAATLFVYETRFNGLSRLTEDQV